MLASRDSQESGQVGVAPEPGEHIELWHEASRPRTKADDSNALPCGADAWHCRREFRPEDLFEGTLCERNAFQLQVAQGDFRDQVAPLGGIRLLPVGPWREFAWWWWRSRPLFTLLAVAAAAALAAGAATVAAISVPRPPPAACHTARLLTVALRTRVAGTIWGCAGREGENETWGSV